MMVGVQPSGLLVVMILKCASVFVMRGYPLQPGFNILSIRLFLLITSVLHWHSRSPEEDLLVVSFLTSRTNAQASSTVCFWPRFLTLFTDVCPINLHAEVTSVNVPLGAAPTMNPPSNWLSLFILLLHLEIRTSCSASVWKHLHL